MPDVELLTVATIPRRGSMSGSMGSIVDRARTLQELYILVEELAGTPATST